MQRYAAGEGEEWRDFYTAHRDGTGNIIMVTLFSHWAGLDPRREPSLNVHLGRPHRAMPGCDENVVESKSRRNKLVGKIVFAHTVLLRTPPSRSTAPERHRFASAPFGVGLPKHSGGG